MKEETLPDPLSEEFAAEVLNGVRDSVAGFLARPDCESLLAPLFDGLAATVSSLVEEALRHATPSPLVACDAGCGFCCHIYDVGATPLEALRIATHVDETFSAARRQALLERIAVTEARKRDHPSERWAAARFPCAFLVDDLCCVHAVRPFACRGYNALDKAQCRVFHDTVDPENRPPEFVAQRRIAELVRDGLRLAVAERGLPGDVVELAPAVHIALTTPFAARRWLAGEPVFAAAECRLPSEGWGETTR